MKIRFSTLALAVATTLGTLGALPAQALQITTSSVNFTGSASVTDTQGGGSTSNSNANLGTSPLTQFDSSLGVLTGTTLNLTSTRTQTTLVTSTNGANTGGDDNVTSNGTGTSNARLVAPGVNKLFSPTIIVLPIVIYTL